MQAQGSWAGSWAGPGAAKKLPGSEHMAHRFNRQHTGRVRAAAFPPGLRSPLEPLVEQIPDPVLKAAIKEPLAFWGGMFAGALGLNLNEEPLKAWIQRTSEAAAGSRTPSQ